jgi:hypothetical protein
VSRLSRQYGILNISQPYRPPEPITEAVLYFFFFTYYKAPAKTTNDAESNLYNIKFKLGDLYSEVLHSNFEHLVTILVEVSCDFPQSLHKNTGTVH